MALFTNPVATANAPANHSAASVWNPVWVVDYVISHDVTCYCAWILKFQWQKLIMINHDYYSNYDYAT